MAGLPLAAVSRNGWQQSFSYEESGSFAASLYLLTQDGEQVSKHRSEGLLDARSAWLSPWDGKSNNHERDCPKEDRAEQDAGDWRERPAGGCRDREVSFCGLRCGLA
jgi:hypothetical protein